MWRHVASRYPAQLCGIVTAVVVWYIWGCFNPTPIFHDEASYILQAKTFASGRLVNPSPPVAEFFEQFHVISGRVFASKYPPGNALALTPGALLGAVAIGPVLFAGVTGWLVVSLARRLSNDVVAILTWVIWLTAQRTLSIRASYFSENVTGTLWLLGWWLILKWQDSGYRRWLILATSTMAFMTLTRPLTGIAYAIPLISTILFTTRRRSSWRQLPLAAIAALTVSTIGPIYNHAVTGDWTTPPWAQYARSYSPFERLGFGLDDTAPERALSDSMRKYNRSFEPVFRSHTIENLPRIALTRLHAIINEMFEGPRLLLLPMIAVSLTAMTTTLSVGLASVISLLICYLSYAHYPTAPYYVEAGPLLGFMAASGLYISAQSVIISIGKVGAETLRVLAFVLILTIGVYVLTCVDEARDRQLMTSHPLRSFFARSAALDGERRIVFIRHDDGHNVHHSLIRNDPDLERSTMWYVSDRGPDNARLLEMFPERVAYLYRQDIDTFQRVVVVRPTR